VQLLLAVSAEGWLGDGGSVDLGAGGGTLHKGTLQIQWSRS
jgi:hypothetical protein